VAERGKEQGGCFYRAGGVAELLEEVSGCGLSYLFRFCKWKHIFIKMNMTGDIYTLRR